MLSYTMPDTFEKSVILGNKCDSSSIMHLEKCFKTYAINMVLKVVWKKRIIFGWFIW